MMRLKVFQCRAFLGLLQENILYTFLQEENIVITVFPKIFDHKAFASFSVFVFPNSTYKTNSTFFSQMACTRQALTSSRNTV